MLALPVINLVSNPTQSQNLVWLVLGVCIDWLFGQEPSRDRPICLLIMSLVWLGFAIYSFEANLVYELVLIGTVRVWLGTTWDLEKNPH